MTVEVRASFVVMGPDDEACDRVLRDLARHRDPSVPLWVTVNENSRRFVPEADALPPLEREEL